MFLGNTGLFDSFTLHIAIPGVILRDPAVVIHKMNRNRALSPDDTVSLSAYIRVSLLPLSNASYAGLVSTTINGTNFSVHVTIPPETAGEWFEVNTDVIDMDGVSLWWPHTAGYPHLYDAITSFAVDSGEAPVAISWRAGFRTVDSAVDPGMGGQVFFINGERIFLQVRMKP